MIVFLQGWWACGRRQHGSWRCCRDLTISPDRDLFRQRTPDSLCNRQCMRWKKALPMRDTSSTIKRVTFSHCFSRARNCSPFTSFLKAAFRKMRNKPAHEVVLPPTAWPVAADASSTSGLWPSSFATPRGFGPTRPACSALQQAPSQHASLPGTSRRPFATCRHNSGLVPPMTTASWAPRTVAAKSAAKIRAIADPASSVPGPFSAMGLRGWVRAWIVMWITLENHQAGI